jgi:TonB family protein
MRVSDFESQYGHLSDLTDASVVFPSITTTGKLDREDGGISVGRALGIAMGIGLLVSVCVFVAMKVSSGSSHNTAAFEIVREPQDMSVSVLKLWADYHSNEVAADHQYKGKRLVVEGQVASVNKGTGNDVDVLFSTFDESETVHADLKAEYQNEATGLRIGQVLKVDCEGGGMMRGELFLMNCSIPPNAPVTQGDPQPEPNAHTTPMSSVQDASANARTQSPTLLFMAPAEYSAEARRKKLQGTVHIRLLVDKNGNPQNVTVVRSLGMGLDESAREAVKHYKFTPAIDPSTGKAVPATMNIGLQFRLP